MINTLMNLIKEIDEVGSQLNSVKSELRQKEFDLKTKKLDLEFDIGFESKREGLKVKEIPKMINDETIRDCQIIIDLKSKRDELEHKLKILELKLQFSEEISSE